MHGLHSWTIMGAASNLHCHKLSRSEVVESWKLLLSWIMSARLDSTKEKEKKYRNRKEIEGKEDKRNQEAAEYSNQKRSAIYAGICF